jgi:hypothetical protein
MVRTSVAPSSVPVVTVDDELFQTLLEQVRDLHRRTDELTHARSRLHENVRARLNWSPAPSLPDAQRRIADEVVEVLNRPRLSHSQSRELYRAYFGR